MGDLLTSPPAFALLAVFAVGLLAWAVAFVLAFLALVHGLLCAYRRLRPRRDVNELPPDVVPEDVLWLACHSTVCGHMQTRQTVTPEGATVCEGCGTPTVSA